MKKFFFLLYLILSNTIINAQTKWTLDSCLVYAKDNNIAVKQASLNAKSQKKLIFNLRLPYYQT